MLNINIECNVEKRLKKIINCHNQLIKINPSNFYDIAAKQEIRMDRLLEELGELYRYIKLIRKNYSYDVREEVYRRESLANFDIEFEMGLYDLEKEDV